MKSPVAFSILAASITNCLHAEDLPARYEAPGSLVLTQFVSAPFPHPDRAQGHAYHEKFFSAQDHYQNSTVALFIPKSFQPGAKIDFIVHFHGWGNSVTNALRQYHLAEQFAASRRNAILVVPQGPLNASDSFDGKLEDPGGFKRFMDEAMLKLCDLGVFASGDIGRIILSGHSGGYAVISSIVARGGLADHIQEIWLFDALYGRTEKFVVWFDHHTGRFVDIYTEHGGTKEETESLMADLTENRVPFFAGDESNITFSQLRDNRLLFLFSALPHDEVLQAHDTFQRLAETSAFDPIAGVKP